MRPIRSIFVQDTSHHGRSAAELKTASYTTAIVAARDARISIFDRGFLFGDGICEVTAVLEGKLVNSEPHMQRLRRSTGEIGIAMPMSEDEIVTIGNAS